MSTFIDYHNADLGGYPPILGAFSFIEREGFTYSRRVRGEVKPGDRIFVIVGVGRPPQHFLWEEFAVEEVEAAAGWRSALGKGWQVVPPRLLSDEAFPGLRDLIEKGERFSQIDGHPSCHPLTALVDAGRDTPDESAEEFFTDLIRGNPDAGYLYACRSYVRYRLNKRARAEKDLEAALRCRDGLSREIRATPSFGLDYKPLRPPTWIQVNVAPLQPPTGEEAISPTAAAALRQEELLSAREKFIKNAGKQIKRPKQQQFREAVAAAYGRRCAVTKSIVLGILQAAHIVAYCETEVQEAYNGILLRSDVHTLFDLHLLRIDPTTYAIMLQPELLDSEYKSLNGVKVPFPAELTSHPKFAEGLVWRWDVAHAKP